MPHNHIILLVIFTNPESPLHAVPTNHPKGASF